MSLLPGFAPPPYTPYQPGSDTSKAAAEKAKDTAPRQIDRLNAFMFAQGARGATQKEMEPGANICRQSLCPRVRELERQGRIRKTDQRRDGCFVYVERTWDRDVFGERL